MLTAALAVGFFGSGLWLIVTAARIWVLRGRSKDTRRAFVVGVIGVLWFGLVVSASTTSPTPTPGTTTTSQPQTAGIAAPLTSTSIGSGTSTTSSTTVATTTTPAADTTTTAASAATTTSTTSPVASGTLVLDVLITIPVEREREDGYSRDLFPHWTDDDGDGCDTREEVLIRDADGTAQVDPIGCTVVAGDWISTYDGKTLSDPTQIAVDHVVALKEAWDSGARDWTTDRRRQFANDLTEPWTLAAVSGQSNQSKGAADPSNWMPPDRNDWCRYLSVWVAIKARWQLSMDESEFGRVRNLLNGDCHGTLMPAGGTTSSSPATTTTTAATTTTTIFLAESPIQISDIVYDGPGNDVVYNDSEYVILTNTGSTEVSVAGWTITDLANQTINIPAGYTVPGGGSLRIYTGPGDSTASRYFAGLPQAIWNNSGGDRATLRDTSGVAVSIYSYTS